ncbi:helix-turn-helix domain-containing protein [Mucilaginibacter sp. KACC 22773]|uniref:helix-turn-helix domain-containing protein n=1 Tax=Mucilaginibacter sp. KACC 22773 TaxID=3025671 RepID=UPI002365F2D8|nr:helix-turn-helix domain-containing protein [Mucilaginibacter sp. KACC 22773]WDF77216.1 helix-turn-helix domain-containing protein [Mucilaginibacter sp. KACC 22773]
MSDPNISPSSEFNSGLKQNGFQVYRIVTQRSVIKSYSRKGIYKICFTIGKSIIHYADKGIEVDGATLFFGNPHIPYSWKFLSEQQTGYACLFSEDFFKGHEHTKTLQESPLFKIGGTPVFALTKTQRDLFASLFEKMVSEQNSEYVFKHDLIRSYINLIIYEALKIEPSVNFFKTTNASSRITTLFFELLERQFPIESTDSPLQIRRAQDFAKTLSLHINHLNRAVKETTGKPISLHIAERIVTEAKALLQHKDWNIAEVAFSLGFEYPTHFNNYFKRVTGIVPSALRSQIT